MSKIKHIKPITKIEVSPDEKYLVTYDGDSIICWSVEDQNENPLKFDDEISNVNKICVSNDKKLACINDLHNLTIYDGMKNFQKIELDCDTKSSSSYVYCTFNLKGELILCNKKFPDEKSIVILIFSMQGKKLNCKKIYKIPKDFEDFALISVSKYNKLYAFSNKSIYECDFITEKNIKILDIDKEIKCYDKQEIIKNIGISSNKNLVCLKIKDKITIYSVELEIPIASLVINNVTHLHKLMKRPYLCSQLFPLLFPLFSNISCNGFWDSIMKIHWKKCSFYLEQNDELEKKFLPNNIRATNKYAFGILDGDIWKIDLKINSDELIDDNFDENWMSYEEENWYFDSDVKINEKTNKIYDLLHILLPNSYMDAIFDNLKSIDELPLEKNLIKWKVELEEVDKEVNFEVVKLEVYKKNNLICSRNEEFTFFKNKEITKVDNIRLLKYKLFDDNNIIILTGVGPLIYYFNENDKSISLNYFYYFYDESLDAEKRLERYKNAYSKSTLSLSNYESFKHNDKWVLDVINNKETLLKYGVELLSFAIKEYKLELIDEIYKKCLSYFKEDFSNKMFLSIITSTMPLLNEYYPEYILKYSLEMTMIIDSPSYSIKYQKNNLHLFSFQYPQMVNLTRSVVWFKYNTLMRKLDHNHNIAYRILKIIQYLIILLTLPIYFATFYILSKFNFIDYVTNEPFSYLYFGVFVKKYSKYERTKRTPTIIFMNPYIKFVTYPKDYSNWFMEFIKPKSSPFVKTTMNREIYKTWEGESLINFKWNIYGKYYYAIIWIVFMVFLGCFTTAATIPHINDDVRNRLLITSIILGFIHLIFEVRQFIYNPIKWIRDFWNIFDVIAYVLPIYTSIIWLQTSELNTIPLLSFSCLFLDIKFLLFFKAYESFGVYFVIIISVAKQIISFLLVLLIIIISFAHAFYILLMPRSQFSLEEPTNNNDPNNPWNLTSTYNRVFENGTIDPNPYTIQTPNENTNMFISFKTAIFAMYLFLTGDSSIFSNWSYTANPSIAVLIVLFSLLIVVYLMNLFIGLLNNAIEKDNNKASYLIQKAEILAEIELFYLLPLQRRWDAWFPDVIYYYADVGKTREKAKNMIDKGEWETNEFPEPKKHLTTALNIQHNSQDSDNETTLQQIIAT